jgi:hypothetical protein
MKWMKYNKKTIAEIRAEYNIVILP